ncbi:hypothetical protein [Litchfieldella rifensis]|uniref:Aminoglycoside phosphotransferase domain-containing protein n=1 Tax=Litchfieldella rifensis TaxID=762643 RepID=A0ABV7LQ46_9GAMM
MEANKATSTDDLAEKVRFLSQPEAYPDQPASVQLVETHFSYVFLTDTRVYKLKKNERYPFLDLSSLEARLANCREEDRLNRWLAPDVYLGIVPLHRTSEGALSLHPDGAVVDYLVHMVRLADERNLEYQLCHGGLQPTDITAAADWMTEFYRHTDRKGTTDVAARRRDCERTAEELMELVNDSRVPELRDQLLRWMKANDRLLAQRALVDAHGDLRPQHLYLGAHPRVIDRLEFDASLRRLDPLEELAFLTLECDRLGQRWVGEHFLERYELLCDDTSPPGLVPFYQASRALTWALLSANHLVTNPESRGHWRERTRLYLDMGMTSLRSMV